jgi:hypothetical protein
MYHALTLLVWLPFILCSFPIPVGPQFNANLTTLDTIQDVFDISSAQSTVITEDIHFQLDTHLIAIGKKDKGRTRCILLSCRNVSQHKKVLSMHVGETSSNKI